jgi:predicted nucleic acid-binding protein
MGQIVMNSFLIDSNIIIYSLDNISEIKNFYNNVVDIEDLLFFSFISEIELLSFSNITSHEEEIVHNLLKSFSKIGINNDIEKITIEIRKKKKLKIPDAIIAASAIYTNSTLVTRNTKDFKNIDGLKLLNPFNIDTN